MKRVLITGADGNIGRQVVKNLLFDSQYFVDALVMQKSDMENAIMAAEIMDTSRLQVITNADFFAPSYSINDYDTVMHLAFSRADKSNEDIASSLDYELRLFRCLQHTNVGRIAYVSSQGIYGKTAEIRTVELPPSPASIYTMAKYAGEKVLEMCFGQSHETAIAIFRLDNVIQSQNLVRTLCNNAFHTGELHLKGGKQCFSYIDVKDAGAAMAAVIRKPDWEQNIYNVGYNRMRITLIQVAEMVQTVAQKHGISVKISLDKDETTLWAGMDTSIFLREFHWTPQFDFEAMVEHIFQEII